MSYLVSVFDDTSGRRRARRLAKHLRRHQAEAVRSRTTTRAVELMMFS